MAAFDQPSTPGESVRQFEEICTFINDRARELMKTPAGRESLRRDLAAMAGVPLAKIKFEGDL